MRKLSLVPLVAVILALAGYARAQQTSHPRLTIDQLIDIKHPSEPLWSPNGRYVAFVWDRAGVSNFYVADADGHGQPMALTSYSDGQVGGAFWSKDGTTLYFPRNGELWQVAATGGGPRPAWTPETQETDIVASPDGTRVAFVRPTSGGSSAANHGSDLYVRSLDDGTESRIAHDDININGISWSPDAMHIAYVGGSQIIHHDESPAYSGAKLIYVITEFKRGSVFVAPASGGQSIPLRVDAGYGALRWVDANHLVFEQQSSDFKKRTVCVIDTDTQSSEPRVLHQDVEEKFWSIPYDAGAEPLPSPNGKWISFLTDQDGWDHLYVMPAAGGQPVQITRGHFESWRPAWSHDSNRIAFDANEPDHPGDRHLGIATIGDDPAHATVKMITAGRGTDIEPSWSFDDEHLVYQHTDPHNSADLFVIDAAADSKPMRLSDSMPASIDRSAFVAPQFVHFPGADGTPVPGWLFVPKNLDRTKKHPAIVWIHGDGINQNYDGWHVERNYAVYYSFHQCLLQEGYVVFAPDYRGSIGYGRDWRDAVYHDIGGKDAKDAWMAGNYLKTLPYVDPNRIGVWGLSYGGFFTLKALTDQPTLFRAGVDVAGVVDFAMYYTDPYRSEWTASRIGTPEQNPEVYAQTAPINHIDRLARPLLILHGTADVNVPFLESVRLIDQILKQKKGSLVSFMMYPGEFHYFSRAQTLLDAWNRVDAFFAANLRPSSVAGH
ncbi:MAG: prolyl oligopeptidase family serine peptidase [Candidatus Acidiferrales bacterium]